MDRAALTALVKAAAREAGFSRVGVASAHDRPDDVRHLVAWLDAGMHGPMAWMAKAPERRADPCRVVEGAASVIMLALDYDSDAPRSIDVVGRDGASAAPGTGWISRYAWGDDYHDVAEKRLRSLTDVVARQVPALLGRDFDTAREFRWMVDYGPLLERRWAQEAGLGWQGKHSLLVDPKRGSFFFLAGIITTLPLVADAPQTDHCGSCTRCIDACPTGAIVRPYVVDARRCISTVTIETRGELEPAVAALVGDHVFGCDICQDVCPFNRFSRPSGEPAFAPRPGAVAPSLVDLLGLDEVGFRERFRRSPLKRAKWAGLVRNVRAVVANQAARSAGD